MQFDPEVPSDEEDESFINHLTSSWVTLLIWIPDSLYFTYLLESILVVEKTHEQIIIPSSIL